jgi:PAS domain S-box-containing protein
MTPAKHNKTERPHRDPPPAEASAAAPPPTDSQPELQRYVDLYQFAPVTYVRLDRYGVIEEINQTGCQMLENSEGNLVGRPLIVYVARESRLDFLEHMRRCRAHDVPVETELAMISREGRSIPVRAYSNRSQAGPKAVYWTVLIDVTEQHRLDEARQQAERERVRAEHEERLGRQTTEATHRFLNVLSHELRTPLTPALFAASRLLEQDMPHGARRLGAIIQRNIQSEARLIDDLLDVSRIERGRLALVFSPTDVHAVLRGAVDECRPQIGSKALTIDLELGAARHVVSGDAGRLRQVFSNLLVNAIKFTDSGRIEVITANDESGALHVSVTDTGIGLEPDNFETLFRVFEQHRGQSSRGGLGLGLAICRGVIASHGGRIWATSPGLGRGATFEVELATVNEYPLEVTPPSTSDAEVSSLRILIVEDDSDTAAVLRELLAQDGHDLDVVRTVRDALKRVAERWDVVISDIGLPDGSGFDVARRFHSTATAPRLIALTGFGSETDLASSHNAGFERHLVKPIDLVQLRRALR